MRKVTDDLSCEYFTNLNIGYEKWFNKSFSGYVRKRQLKNFSEFTEGCKRFIDVGCGTGNFLSIVKCDDKTGVDISPEMIEVCRVKCPEANLYVAPSNSLPFSGDSFDCVVMLNVFQYIEKPQETVNELLRIARPGGRIMFTVFNKNSISLSPIRFFIRKLMGEDLPYVNFYSPVQIINMLERKHCFMKGSGIRPPFESKLLFEMFWKRVEQYEDLHRVPPWLAVETFVYIKK